MKKGIGIILSLLCVMVLLTGCVDSGTALPSSGGAPASTADAGTVSGKLVINGSTSMEKLMNAECEAFQKRNSEFTFEVQGTGSGDGIKSIGEKTADLGTSSRNVKDEEKTSFPGLKETVVAYDGIAVVLHPDNPVTELTSEQAAKIFKGEITNWKEVGGEDRAIMVVVRESGSGTRDGFEEKLEIKDRCTRDAIEAKETGIVKSTVAGEAGGIGYMSLGSVDNTLKTVKLNGVNPTSETVLNGTYKIQRPFICITNGEPSGLAKSFLDFMLSTEGQAVVEAKGFVKLA